jgi:uncharacterized protein YjbJ (UPF0337 family)
MNREQFKGQWKQFKGELKKQWGQFTDDDLMQIEGDYDKFIGSLQERYGEQKEEVRRWVDQWFDRHQPAKTGAMPKAG